MNLRSSRARDKYPSRKIMSLTPGYYTCYALGKERESWGNSKVRRRKYRNTKCRVRPSMLMLHKLCVFRVLPSHVALKHYYKGKEDEW